ncbi:thermonuclease family protein [Reyranella sp.]|uniref:thermonuclease family protein n=1 Tax=Reyranella sp. TaxID=1929291 RepID=UPI003BAC31E6
MKRLILASAALAVLALPVLALPVAALAQSGPRKPAPAPAPAPPPPSRPDGPDCAAQGPLPATWSGEAYVADGNTIVGVGLKAPIRLWGVQAPELRDAAKAETVPGMRARATLQDLLDRADHKLKCRPIRFDRDCRIVAHCTVNDALGGDIGSGLIAAGMAYGIDLNETLAFEPHAGQRYATAEAEARKQRRGLWKEWLGEK